MARWEHWLGSKDGADVSLLWPLTFMNLSGRAVDFLAARFGAPPQDQILVVVDDLSLPLGQVRLRKRGSSGGHNGLKSIESLLGHGDYARLRLGIGQPPAGQEVVDFVLSPFDAAEVDTAKAVSAFAASSVAEWNQGVSFEGLVGKVNGWRSEG
jgi:PTH1 family peptidyl-tRNA hydrolase